MAASLYDAQYAGSFLQTTGGRFEVANDAELQRARDLYDGEVFFADHLFGRLIAHLRDRGLLDKTVVVVTSDHGEAFVEHGHLQHRGLHEEVIRIPLLIRHPAVPVGSRSEAPFINVDLLPTLAAVVDVPAPQVADGLDLTRAWRDDRMRISVAMTRKDLRQISGTRGGDKLVVTCRPRYQEQLFDLRTDRAETVDRAREDPETAARVLDAVQQQVVGDPCTAVNLAMGGRAAERNLTREQIEKLKSLGYLDPDAP